MGTPELVIAVVVIAFVIAFLLLVFWLVFARARRTQRRPAETVPALAGTTVAPSTNSAASPASATVGTTKTTDAPKMPSKAAPATLKAVASRPPGGARPLLGPHVPVAPTRPRD